MHIVGRRPSTVGAAMSLKLSCCKCSDDHKAFWFQRENENAVLKILAQAGR